MFERYTEKARRVIFFSRYEASQLGSSYIETEHLLLGITREERRLMERLLSRGEIESLRPEIESLSLKNEPITTSLDLPLSNESKHVLAYAAEESERLGDRHIRTEHLLLGLLEEENCFGAQLLRNRDITLETVRNIVSQPPPQVKGSTKSHLTYRPDPRGFRSDNVHDTVEVHGSLWDAEYIRDLVKKCREFSWQWTKRRWRPRDIAIHRESGRVSFEVALARKSKEFYLAKQGWKKDYCAVCRWELSASDDPLHASGYTNGRDWLCLECYEKFIATDFFGSAYRDIT